MTALYGKITAIDGDGVTIRAPYTEDIARMGAHTVEMRLLDPRKISAEQRKKTYAMFADMADYLGYTPDQFKALAKYWFISKTGTDYFSLSDVDRTTARDFLSYLIELCLEHGIPTLESLLNRTDDIDTYLYLCLLHRKCAICHKPADIHHEDAIGMGRDRGSICHVGMSAMALCRTHHGEAHNVGRHSFCDKHHIYGIPLDEKIVKKHKLGRIAPHGMD